MNNLTDELVAVIGKCSLTHNKQEVIRSKTLRIFGQYMFLLLPQVARMAELAAGYTHLEAVSCSLLARLNPQLLLQLFIKSLHCSN